MKLKHVLIVPSLLAGLGGVASANAFLLNEFDARAIGRGDAVVASDTEPSAIYYNIGGMAAAEGTRVMITGAVITPNASYTDTSGVKTDSNTPTQYLPGVFVTSRVHEMVSVGIGFYTPFGLAVSWPDSSPQNNVIKQETLHTFFITPSVGVNLNSVVPGLTAGAGIDIVPATVDLLQDVYFGTDRGEGHLAGKGTGVGGRIGVMYRPQMLQALSLGLTWRSDVKVDFSGNGNFNAPAPYRSSLPPDGPVTTSITLPQTISGGASYHATDELEVEANVVWTNWSKFKQLNIDVPAPTTGTMTISQNEAYTDKVTFRLGVEYRLPSLGAAVRAGYIYDPTPVPTSTISAQLPDINRHDLTAGASYNLGNFDLHAGLLFVLPGKSTADSTLYMPQYKGTYDVSAFVGSLSLSGKLF